MSSIAPARLESAWYSSLYRGQNAAIASATVDAGQPVSASDAAPVVGALSLLGRLEEAEYLFASCESAMRPAERVIARSFLTIAAARLFHFEAARRYIAASFAERRDLDLPEARCLFFQSIGIVRYFLGQLGRARVWAERARGQALLGGFLYGRIFASDLLGHIDVALGDVHRGLELLDGTRTLAATLGHTWLVDALKVSTTCYRARHGLVVGDAVEVLRSLLEQNMDPDSFNRPGLLLELSRQLVLRGRASEALDILSFAAGQIYTKHNVRFDSLLHLGMAHVHVLRGAPVEAASLLRSALARVAGGNLPGVEVALRGLLARVEGQLGDGQDQIEAVDRLTRTTGIHIAHRIWGRSHGRYLVNEVPGQDPLGDLIDRAHREGPDAAETIMRHGLLGLLLPALGVPPGAQLVFVRRRTPGVVVLDRGDVTHVERVPDLSRRLLCVFGAHGLRSKEDLCRDVWGYDYHPERHDGLIYSAISKLRRAHPALEAWVEATDEGYRLRPGVRVVLFDEAAEAESPGASDVRDASRLATEFALNLRQTQLLEIVRERGNVDVRTARAALGVSEVTASRDLKTLTERGLLSRVGKGRATRYVRGDRFVELPSETGKDRRR